MESSHPALASQAQAEDHHTDPSEGRTAPGSLGIQGLGALAIAGRAQGKRFDLGVGCETKFLPRGTLASYSRRFSSLEGSPVSIIFHFLTGIVVSSASVRISKAQDLAQAEELIISTAEGNSTSTHLNELWREIHDEVTRVVNGCYFSLVLVNCAWTSFQHGDGRQLSYLLYDKAERLLLTVL